MVRVSVSNTTDSAGTLSGSFVLLLLALCKSVCHVSSHMRGVSQIKQVPTCQTTVLLKKKQGFNSCRCHCLVSAPRTEEAGAGSATEDLAQMPFGCLLRLFHRQTDAGESVSQARQHVP